MRCKKNTKNIKQIIDNVLAFDTHQSGRKFDLNGLNYNDEFERENKLKNKGIYLKSNYQLFVEENLEKIKILI